MWPFNKGGKEKRLHEVSRRLAAYGRDVHIYTMQWWEGSKIVQLDGITFHAISKLHPLYSGDRRSIRQALLFGVAVLKLVFEPFDVIEVDHMPYFPLFSARAVCVLRRKRLYTTWHEVWGREYWRDYLGVAGIMGNITERLAIAMPHHIVSVSEHTRGRLERMGSSQPTSVLLNGVDLEALDAATPAAQHSDVLFAGRLLKNKNVDLLVEAIALLRPCLPDLRCLIVGEGPERARLESLVASLALTDNVTFVDFVPDLYAVMKASKVFALPSVREGFGLVVVEANVCGLPVITTRHNDNAARFLIVEGQNGYLIDPDASQLAERIGRILGQGPEGKGLASDPRRVVVDNGFAIDWGVTARSVDDLYSGRQPQAALLPAMDGR